MGSRRIQKCVNGVVTAVALLALLHEPCEGQQRRARVSSSGAGGQQGVEFDCPEEFGYYPHPSDCTQYYVCVFGGALLESCTGGLMYSHELQTCDWPRNVGCGAEESATISTVRVTDPRTRHTTPTGSPSRTVPVSRGQQQQQQREQQQRQQQEEIAKHQLYADDLGPAEEVENDRQQRVYRGQPSTVGQVARDRDGLRHQVTNAIPAPPGRVASGEKIGVISFGTQHQQQQQYSFDELTLDNNFLLTNETHRGRREKRQVRYSRFPGQGGPVLQLSRPGLNTFSSLTVPVLSNGANYNSYQTFGPVSNNPAPVPIPPPAPRPSNPAPPPSSDNDYRPIINTNIPNNDIRHFRSPENYLTSGQRPPPNIQFTQTNNNFKPRPPQTPNPAGSAYNLRQYLNQPPAPPNIELQPQQPSSLPLGIDLRQQQPLVPPNINYQQQNNINPLLQNLNQNAQFINPTYSLGDLGPTSFTNFQQSSEIFPNPSASGPPTFLSSTNHQQTQSQNHVTPRNPSTPGIIYQNQNPPEEENFSYLLFERPNTAAPAIQYAPTSTENPLLHQQPPFQNYATTLRTLPAGQNSLGFPHDTLSFDEIHKHEQRETSHHLVPPPPPPSPPAQQTEKPQHNPPTRQTWQKLLREQQDEWSPLPHSTEALPPTFNIHSTKLPGDHQHAPYSSQSQSHSFEDHGIKPQLTPQSQTEGPFRPNTNPYGDNGRFVGIVYKDNDRPRLNHDLYTNLPSTSDSNYNNQHQNRHAVNEYPKPSSSPILNQNTRQKTIPPNENFTDKPHRNIQRPQSQTSVVNPSSHPQNSFPDESQQYVKQNHDVAHHSESTSIPYDEYESVKLPVQTNNGKHRFGKLQASDYREDVYDERKPADYDDKTYYDEEALEEEHYRLERPEAARQPESNADTQHYNRANIQKETRYRDNRRKPSYETDHANKELPQSDNRGTSKQESSEQIHDENHDSQKLPQKEQSSTPTVTGAYKTETYEDGKPSNNDGQTRTNTHAETTTEDRFPPPPPEFYEELDKYRDIENPFANLDFDFDAYLDKLRGSPSPISQPESSKVEDTKTKQSSESSYYQTESDKIKSTTYQNLVPVSEEITTTRRPRIRQRQRPIQPIQGKSPRRRPSQVHTTEYIKEYYPPHNPDNFNEDGQVNSKEIESQRKNQQEKSTSLNPKVILDDVYQEDQVSSTTNTPQVGIATVNRQKNPDPLTVPFYPGEDGNFYINPAHIQPQNTEENNSEGSKVQTFDTQPPVDTYYKYSLEEDSPAVSSIVQSTERNPRILSTSESYPHSHRGHYNKFNKQETYDSAVTSIPVASGIAKSHNPILDVISISSEAPKPPGQSPLRNKAEENVGRIRQKSEHAHVSQTTETYVVNDNSKENVYYDDSVQYKDEVTTQSVRQNIKVPLATPVLLEKPHPFTATASTSNKYKYHDAYVPSTQFTPPNPHIETIGILSSDTKSKKADQIYIVGSGEENDTIKPLRNLKNERIPESHKVSTTTYSSTIPSTTEYLTTSSTTQFSGWDTYNSWQGTTPYKKEISDFEITTPTQPKHRLPVNNASNKFRSEIELTTPTLSDYTTVDVANIHSTTITPVTNPATQTSTRPSNELLDSIYDIAKSMFNPQYDTILPGKVKENVYFEPSSENVKQNSATEILFLQSNSTTTLRPKLRRRRPINKTPRPTTVVNHVAEYTTSSSNLNDHNTPETYTIRRRPSKDHSGTSTRHRVRRPQTTTVSSTATNVIITASLPSNDIDAIYSTTVKSPSPTRRKPPVTSRRLRRPTKTRVDITSTEVYADNDKSESFERPLQDNVNRLNRKPLPEKGSNVTTAPHRVEPSVAPVTYVQQPAVQAPASPNVYNNSQRYDPTQYDPYYNLYDEEVELYRDVADYSQFPSNQGSRQSNTNANNQQPTYRGQSPYKQPPQVPPQEPQRNAAYAQPSYNNQQDVYVQNIDQQEYNENYNTATDDQTQYNQQAAPRQPSKSPSRGDRNELNFAPQSSSTTSTTIPPTTITTTTTTTTIRTTTAPSTTTTVVPTRQQTRLRVDPTTATNNNKYNAVLAAIATSSPNDQATATQTTTTQFQNIPDFDTPYLLTLQNSKTQPSSRQVTPSTGNTNSRQPQKPRRITLTSAFSLDDPFSTTSSKPSQYSRPRGPSLRISTDSSGDSITGRRGSDVISLGASLSGTPRSGSQTVAPSQSQNGNIRRTATNSFTVIDNTNSNTKAFSLDAEISAIENSFTQQNSTPRRGEERTRGSSRSTSNANTVTRSQNQNQRGSIDSVQRTRLVQESTTITPQNDLHISRESPSSKSSAVPSRIQSRQPDTPAPHSSSDSVTPRSISRTPSNEIITSPLIRISPSTRGIDTRKEPSPSALRSSYQASLVEADDVHSGLSRNSIIQQSDVSTNNRARSRGSSQRKPTSCADAIDTNSNAGCDEKPQIRVRPTTASPDSQSTPAPARGNNAGRTRGSASYTTGSGAEPTVNRGTPASVSRSRPTLKPSTAIVSKAQEFIDIYRNPARRPDPVYPTPQVDKTAAKCRKDVCLLPDCSCGSKDIPGDLPAEEVPQMVLLTFDDAINDLNKGLYQDIFEKGRTNPNGCPITATFYVSHEWTDYSQVQNLYADGHEMASHSVSHSFGEQFSQKKWTKEIAGQREILAAYGGVRLEDVRGMRAPFLAIGGNKMFKMLYDSNFTYDSSMPVYENRPPSWPYTLDYKIFHDCMIPPCPTRSYPGVWEVPMVMWQDLNGGRCSMGDACSNPPTADGVYKMLIKNFERHYTTNRAPFGLFYHAAWFTQPHHKEGFIAFLDTIVNMQDVWLVTNWQALQWVRDPTPLSRTNGFPPFQCNYPERPRRCNNPKVCNLWHKSGVRYMRTCQPCPDVYPWTGKTGVRNSRVDNEIVEES